MEKGRKWEEIELEGMCDNKIKDPFDSIPPIH